MSNSQNAQRSHDDYDGDDERRDNSTKRRHDFASSKALPSLRIEVAVIDGDEGRKLHALQAQALFEALLWLAEHRPDTEDISEENA